MRDASKSMRNGKEVSLSDPHNVALSRRRFVANNITTSSSRQESCAETGIAHTANHAEESIHLLNAEKIDVDGLPKSEQNPDLSLAHPYLTSTLPSTTQGFQDEDVEAVARAPSQSLLGEQRPPDSYSTSSSCSDFDSFITPPPPSDLEALHKTWEQVRTYRAATSISTSAMTLTPSTCSEQGLLHSRGGRIAWKWHSSADWDTQGRIAGMKLTADSSTQAKLQHAGVWLTPETEDGRSDIENQINWLEKNVPTVEAEWSSGLWQRFFFKSCPRDGQRYQRWLERRQTHTLSKKQSKSNHSASTANTEETSTNYYPPILSSRLSVPVSDTPYDVNPDRKRNGFVFSDLSYAAYLEDVHPERLDLLRKLPTIRLYKDSTHHMEGLRIEVKPQMSQSMVDSEVHEFSVRYLTFTGMTMLQEYLKLCYMSSDDPDFFSVTEPLSLHLISAVGCIARHYTHKLRSGPAGEPVKFMSYYVRSFNMKEVDDRNAFRKRLNEIHVLNMTIIKEALQNKMSEILALDSTEIQQRLDSRTHKHVRFVRAERNGYSGFSVEQSSSTDQSKISNRNGENPRIPWSSSAYPLSNIRSAIYDITKTPEPDHNIEIARPASTSQESILEPYTKKGKARCQARGNFAQQCSYAARPNRKSCNIPRHQQYVESQLSEDPERS